MRIAIVMPAHNEEEVLDESLSSAVREAGREHVYVANDASTDATAQIATHYVSSENVNTLATNGGKARALRDTLARYRLAERYDAIFFQDADTVLSAGHLTAVAAGMAKKNTAFAVGRVESQYKPVGARTTFWVRYRAYMMWLYNWTIRLPQSKLGVVNVLPGSSVLISASAVRQIDWSRVGEFALDDYHQLVQIKLKSLGGAAYVSNSPPANIREPLTLSAFLKQTRRWWFGIGEIHRAEKLWRKRGGWFLFNNFHLASWLWSAVAPFVATSLLVASEGTYAFWIILFGVAISLGEALVLCLIYVFLTGRITALALLPAFCLVAYCESVFFLLCFFRIVRANRGGRWSSPPRVAKERGGA